MELALVIVGLVFALILVYKLVKGVVGLIIKLAIIATAIWAISHFQPGLFS